MYRHDLPLDRPRPHIAGRPKQPAVELARQQQGEHAGLEKLSDRKGEAEPSQRLVARLRRLARFVPFHRLYHSVELTMVAFAAAVIGLFLPSLVAERWLLLILLPLAVLALIGHFVAIMASKRVRS